MDNKILILSLIILNGFLLGTGIHSVIRAENNNQLDGWEWVFIVLLIIDFFIFTALHMVDEGRNCGYCKLKRADRQLLKLLIIGNFIIRLLLTGDDFSGREGLHTTFVVFFVLFVLNNVYTSFEEYNLFKKDSDILPVGTGTKQPNNGQYKNLRY